MQAKTSLTKIKYISVSIYIFLHLQSHIDYIFNSV